ncbi:pyruvate carboxylase [Syncephalis fuscata]|nr:pyruvate carboxylase [Syncephalis fuscata]
MQPTVESIRRRSSGASVNSKVLVANRGEIATRVFRSAHEIGLRTVAIFSYEDRFSLHRSHADGGFMISKPGELSPVGAYLAQDEIIRIALQQGVDVIHPGYGFLSENAEFARKVEQAGIAFAGPPADVIEKLGDKTRARQIAIECGVPVIPGTPGPLKSLKEAELFCAEHGFPIIIKAAMGGGGRGMRVVNAQSELADAFERAQSEALAAFGDGTVFIERFLERPRHIEVQLLADSAGNVIHLFERDCSVQRRHQKVVEIAPARFLDEKIRQAILDDAVKMARYVNYRNAGTAEFLLDQNGRHYFIEINPRIQVEHTITEEITGIDIVAAQLRIAFGVTLPELNLTQESIQLRGYAIQCRITTEDPQQNFQPDTGRIEVYSIGRRGFAGSIITPHYDSLLVKLTCRGMDYSTTVDRVFRALTEFRIRGVKSNISFLQQLIQHETFRERICWTTFIDDTPELFDLVPNLNRAQRLLAYLGDLAVNGSSIKGQMGEPTYREKLRIPVLPPPCSSGPNDLLPDTTKPCAEGWRKILLENGPEAFAQAIRKHPGTLIMDTTWRDAHQSLLATRLRTIDIARVAAVSSHAFKNAFSMEMWGGATFDVAMRFLYEDPWDRLKKLRALCPNIPFQMLLRGANAVGYTSYPDNVTYEFCKKARSYGIDVFRVFDSLNYMENLKLGMDAVRQAGGVIEAVICYTGDVSNPQKTKYNLDYYLDLTAQLVKEGAHVLGIKDMAGLLKPRAATMLVKAIREKFPDLPIHVHTHDTAGTGVASMLAAAEAGADVVDVAVDSMSGLTSQPSMGAIVAALQGTSLDTGIRHADTQAINAYWEQIRMLYSCFDPGLKSNDSGVYEHEMPGGQYTNLLFQAQSLGLGEQWEEVKKSYCAANDLCGDIVKVTPSSKVVGDLAQFMVSNKLTAEQVKEKARSLSFPTSVVEFFQGQLGQPVGGFPEPLRSNIIKNLPPIEGRPGESMAPFDFESLKVKLEKAHNGRHVRDVDVISAALYPKVYDEFQEVVEKYGDLSLLPTQYFLAKPHINEEFEVELEPGKIIIIKLLAIGPLNSHTGLRDVFFELNGETRVVGIDDKNAAIEHVQREKASANEPGDIGCPMSGVVVEVRVKEGVHVNDGDPICVLSAMKMETVVSAPVSGRVERILVAANDSLVAGDLIAHIVKD